MATVADVSLVQAELEAKRALPRCLMEGTDVMRREGKTYLPQHPAESKEAWEARRDATVLLPAYRDAVELANGLIFRKAVEPGDNVPEDAKDWLKNIDLAGRDITQFAEAVLTDAFDGVSFLVADYPVVPVGSTRAQEIAMGARPYLVHVKCRQVRGWRTAITNGHATLAQFRYMETITVPDGQFGSKEIQRMRVLEPGIVSVYIKSDSASDWVLDPENSGISTLKEVPVIAIYTGRTGFMTGIPPLRDLARKNCEHWQSSSDQRNILHVARVPLLALIGFDQPQETVIIGPQNTLSIPLHGDAKWVEHTGKAIEAGRIDLQDLETQMQRMAGKILDSGIAKTATQSDTESIQASSKIQAWALGLQSGLNQAWALCGKWIGQDLGTLKVNTDFDTKRPDAQFLTEIRNAVIAGLLTKETYLKILFSAEVLPEGFDIQAELDKLEMEAPDLSAIPPRRQVGGAT